MSHSYIFQTPRNLYEKLCREAESLDYQIEGDNLFNFIATAYCLKDWIKKSPLNSSTVVKRFLKRLNNDNNLKLCQKIVLGDTKFEISPKKIGCQLKVDNFCVDVVNFRKDILALYEVYFKIR
ncbi:MAG: hypothetical protein CR986_07600 [Ignavibacteriae bacterium]|nr:MAG: hypothetical protein CR986_07600 [Ignavibacteriota bacterium]